MENEAEFIRQSYLKLHPLPWKVEQDFYGTGYHIRSARGTSPVGSSRDYQSYKNLVDFMNSFPSNGA